MGEDVTGPRVVFSSGCLAALAARVGELGGTRVLLLTTERRRFVDQAIAGLAGLEVAVFDRARPHVPREVVTAAAAAVADHRPDTIVALGGGAAIGLGKALRLEHDLCFVAIPTTYSGSEMTSVHGITEAATKTTGRSVRVRPDLVLYDPTLTSSLPLTPSIQGLCNALSHPVGVLSTDTLAEADRARALEAIGDLRAVIEELLLHPASLTVRTRALRAASAAGRAIDAGTVGLQHRLVHLLGGRFGLEHAALHSAVLPAFLAWLRRTRAELVAEIDRAANARELEGELFEALRRAGAPTSLAKLGVTAEALRGAAADHPDLPDELLTVALAGIRPERP